MAANKSDLFDKEQVSEAEAREYAKEIGAVFKLTSACTASGIEELFKSIGCKYLDPNFKEDEDGTGHKGAGAVKLEKEDKNEPKQPQKKKFC